jgi:hypothetical protein
VDLIEQVATGASPVDEAVAAVRARYSADGAC